MIARVTDECFWLGRYIERAEATARALASMRTLALDVGEPAVGGWRRLLQLTGEEAGFVERHGAAALADAERVEHSLTWEEQNGGCVLRSVRGARENARSVRDLLTLEVWEALNELHLWLLSPAAGEEYAHERFGFYTRVRSATQLVLGQTQSTMLHDTALDFIWLGVLLERAGWTVRLLDAHPGQIESGPAFDGVMDSAAWAAVLRSSSGLEPYLRRARGLMSTRGICAFLLLDTAFPRSVLYAVKAARMRLEAIDAAEGAGPAGEVLPAARALEAFIGGLDCDGMDTPTFHGHLARMGRETDALCDAIARGLMAPAPPKAWGLSGAVQS